MHFKDIISAQLHWCTLQGPSGVIMEAQEMLHSFIAGQDDYEVEREIGYGTYSEVGHGKYLNAGRVARRAGVSRTPHAAAHAPRSIWAAIADREPASLSRKCS